MTTKEQLLALADSRAQAHFAHTIAAAQRMAIRMSGNFVVDPERFETFTAAARVGYRARAHSQEVK